MGYGMNQEQMGVNIVPGQTWGTYKFPGGEVVKIQEVSDQVYYDSEILPTAIGAGFEFRMCISPTFVAPLVGAKVPDHDYNLPEFGRVPVGWLYRIQVVGFHLLAGTLSGTLIDVSNHCHMQFMTGSQTKEVDGNLIYFPSGAGIGGSIALDGGGVANEVSGLNIGSPAISSLLPKRYPIDLPEQVSFETRIRFPIGLAVAADPSLIVRYGAVIGANLGAQLYVDLRMVRYRIVR